MDPDASVTLRVEAGKTYLVEMLAAAAEPDELTPQTRLELKVEGEGKTKNLPYVARLPLERLLRRGRAAFRADESGEVTLFLRGVEPRKVKARRGMRLTYEGGPTGEAGLLVGDVVVASIGFRGPNLLLDHGPRSDTDPRGSLSCEVRPWTGGNSTVRHEPYPCPRAAQRAVDGVIANQKSAWTTEATGKKVQSAEGMVRFDEPETLTSIAIYEDNTGPVPTGKGVKEKTAMRYGLYVRNAESKRWVSLGPVTGNTHLINVFECPDFAIDRIRYFWAGRSLAHRTDGVVRMLELEAYADEMSVLMEDAPEEGPALDW